jgi:xanthosine utilization system XapX-like protein
VLGIGFIVAFVYQLLNYNADGSPPLIEQALKTLVVLLISGGIFTYYWLDEHRTEQK